MKPISDKSFADKCDQYAIRMVGSYTSAMVTLIQNIGLDTDPECHDINDFDNFIDEVVTSVYEWTSTVEGLKNYLVEKITNEHDKMRPSYWGIGDKYVIGGEEYVCEYKALDSFLKDIDFELALTILKECWKDACN